MEATTLQAPVAAARPRLSLGTALLRLRSDEQLLALFRDGHDEAFRVIHDRYRQRLFAYTRQMLPQRQDAEDALQDVFVRAYSRLRSNDRQLALRAWLFRVAHNRCVDELRRPSLPPPEVLQFMSSPVNDPIAQVDQRESLRRLIADVRRLPESQRSALLMRELGGMSYADVGIALGISVPAVKSLLVRARIALAKSVEARDTACAHIREELTLAHDRGVRPNAISRRHLHDCIGCREFRNGLRGTSRQLAALAPTLGPLGFLANALGFGGAGGGASAGGGAAVVGGGGAFASVGMLSTGHVATLIAAAVVTAGGAVEIQNTILSPSQSSGNAPVVSAASSASVQPPAPTATPTVPTGTVAAAPRAAAPTAPSVASPPASTPQAGTPDPSPIGRASTTGIDSVSSSSRPATGSPMGHTSITGIDAVSAPKPSSTTKPGETSSSTTGTSSSSSGSGGSVPITQTSSGSSTQSGSSSAGTSTGSSQVSPAPDSSVSSPAGKSPLGTTSTGTP